MNEHLSIRRLTEADLDAANDILAAAYDSPASRATTLRRYLQIQPDGWLLALLDGQPVGVGGAVNYGPFASIGSVGVRPEAQRRGVALALMERLLSWLQAAGCGVAVLVATEAGAPLYTRLGFVEAGATLVCRREGSGQEIATASSPHDQSDSPPPCVSALNMADLPALARFDAPIFGAARPAVLTAYAAADPARAFVVRDDAGELAGYLIAQGQTLGPWGARTPQDAEALLTRALQLPFEGGLTRVIVPPGNTEAMRLLRRHGFGEPFALRHMRRGGTAAPGRPAMLYGQASFAIG